MCDILSARPAFSTAATESPPPMMVQVPDEVISARHLATSKVPAANASNSKTPIGPFHTTVLHDLRASTISLVASGPLSRPIQPSGMASAFTTLVLASAANLSAMTMSDGRISSQLLSLASFSAALAVSMKSSSTSDEPVAMPRAARKVKTMPPPMTTLSHFLIRASRTVIFDETLEPPTMAASGFSPSEMAPSRNSSSLARRKPETDGERNLVTPSVEAWARWAVPNASLTKRSNGAASFSTKPASFFSSSL
mmetsp:Transcript_56328/g.155513  ORF Transcript_56328/g.155513 Transcript_56328/m.155513 type:complete len:253 (+) Transcript_56328:318-1076(+)